MGNRRVGTAAIVLGLIGTMMSGVIAKSPVERLATFAQATQAIDTRDPQALIVAHRGNGCGGEENSLRAMERCLAAGVRAVEIDVRYTRDNIPVIMHDQNLWRTTGCFGPVGERTYAQLQECRLPDGSAIPTLEKVLTTYNGKLLFDLDMKEPQLRLTVETIARIGAFPSTYLHVFGEEHFAQLKDLQTQYPDVRYMPSIRDETELAMARAYGFAHRVAEVPQSAPREFIKKLLDTGLTVQSRIKVPVFNCEQYASMRLAGITIIQADAPLILLDECVEPLPHRF